MYYNVCVESFYARQKTVVTEENLRFDGRVATDDPDGKLSLLLDYAEGMDGEISDPWYTRDFDLACREIEAGCRGLLKKLSGQDQNHG